MVGQRSGETYRLGDSVTVKLVEAAPVAGALRFELLSPGSGKRPGKKSHTPNPPQAPDARPRAAATAAKAANNGSHDDETISAND